MSNTPRRAFGSASTKKRSTPVDLSTALNMLPLVKIIVQDIVESNHLLNRLHPEQESLDRHRRDLVWLERERRYQITEQVSQAEAKLKEAVTELSQLGVKLLDVKEGRVGFPTKIEGRVALFDWKPDDDTVQYFCFDEEDIRRPIPSDWASGSPMRTKGKP